MLLPMLSASPFPQHCHSLVAWPSACHTPCQGRWNLSLWRHGARGIHFARSDLPSMCDPGPSDKIISVTHTTQQSWTHLTQMKFFRLRIHVQQIKARIKTAREWFALCTENKQTRVYFTVSGHYQSHINLHLQRKPANSNTEKNYPIIIMHIIMASASSQDEPWMQYTDNE